MAHTLVLIVVVLALLGAVITVWWGAGSKEAERMASESDDRARSVYAAALKKGEEAERAFRERHN
jgi:hypothetical protein